MDNKIGLTAVMEMAGFTSGINKYNEMVNGAGSNTDKQANGMSKAFSAIGTAAAGLAVGGIAVLTTAIVGGITATTKWAETVDGVGDVLGTTAEESSALAVAAKTIGGDVTQLSSQMAILTRGLTDAKGEIGPTGKVLQSMGISFKDANGKMLPTTTILQSVADKLGNMPDGLEKTQLMMDLFGKSGKDMSDMMGVLANGGMEDMNQKAKDMGLSMSEQGTAGAIAFGRSMNDLKMMGQGLMVTIGNELMPVLLPLIQSFMQWARDAMPSVRQAIADAIPVIQEIAQWIGEKLFPPILAFADWVKANWKPLLAGFAAILLTIVVPAFIAWAGAAAASAAATLAALAPVIAIVAAVGAAVFLLYKAWDANFLGIRTTVTEFWNDHLKPIFENIWSWLSTKVPQAIDTAKTWFNEHLLPALRDIWAYIQDPLIPTLGKIVAWLETIIKGAITTFKEEIWPKLKAAFKTVKDFIVDELVPKLDAIVTWLGTTIKNAIDTFKGIWSGLTQAFRDISNFIYENITGPNGVFTKVVGWLKTGFDTAVGIAEGVISRVSSAFNTIKDAVQWVINKINEFIELISNIKIPDWIPHSPGIIDSGLYQIATAFQVATIEAGRFNAAISGIGGISAGLRSSYNEVSSMPVSTMAGASTNNYTYHQSVSIPISATINNGMDYETFKSDVLNVVSGALR